MKNILLAAAIIFFLITSLGYAQDCNIHIWEEDGSSYHDPIPTLETTRTITAASVARDALSVDFGAYPPTNSWCTSLCCFWSFSVTGAGAHNHFCIDGNWEYGEYAEDPWSNDFTVTGIWDVVCVTDNDSDGIDDGADNCPNVCNPSQLDADGDGIGDSCDTTAGCGGLGQPACEVSCDADYDGISILIDNCPDTCNIDQLDADEDGLGDVCDDTPGCGGCGEPDCETECWWML